MSNKYITELAFWDSRHECVSLIRVASSIPLWKTFQATWSHGRIKNYISYSIKLPEETIYICLICRIYVWVLDLTSFDSGVPNAQRKKMHPLQLTSNIWSFFFFFCSVRKHSFVVSSFPEKKSILQHVCSPESVEQLYYFRREEREREKHADRNHG